MITTKTVSPHGLLSYNFNTEKEGTHLLVIANIHGNEVCGTHATNATIKQLLSGEKKLSSGQLTLVASCNPPAHTANVRAVNVDMNRIVGKTETIDPSFYEIGLARELEVLIQSCDVMLSIHACSADTVPFAIRDWDTDSVLNNWSHNIGCQFVVTGWENIHPSAGDTASFAKAYGKKSLTIECGTVGDVSNVQVASDAIDKSLLFWKLEVGEKELAQSEGVIEVEMMQEVVRPNGGVSELSPIKPQNLEAFSTGDVLATLNNETYCSAPFDGVFIMPDIKAESDESWFYIAEIKK